MPYAILRFMKKKSDSVTAAYNHNERKKEAYKSNSDIDINRSVDNYHLIAPQHPYRKEAFRLIQAAGCKTRKNSTVMVEALITASPEFMRGLSPPEQREYFQTALNFISSEIGQQNIIAATVHMDEKTPHMHLCFCPITQDNRLSAKDIVGNKVRLSKWQDGYHAAMSDRWPELERGIPAVETKRKHIPTWLFKAADRLDRQAAEVEHALSQISPFNAKKQRDTALDLLKTWLPKAEAFTAQIKTVDDYIKSLELAQIEVDKRIQEIKDEAEKSVDEANFEAIQYIQTIEKDAESRVEAAYNSADSRLVQKDYELTKAQDEAKELRQKIRNQENIIRKIPFEVRQEIMKKSEKERGNNNERNR